jgi:hypothetical protein
MVKGFCATASIVLPIRRDGPSRTHLSANRLRRMLLCG